MHPDDALRARRRRRDLGHRERRRVRREHRVGPADPLELGKSSRFGSSSSTIASITRSQSARSARSVVRVNRPTAASCRVLGRACPSRPSATGSARFARAPARPARASPRGRPSRRPPPGELRNPGSHRTEPDDPDLPNLRHQSDPSEPWTRAPRSQERRMDSVSG